MNEWKQASIVCESETVPGGKPNQEHDDDDRPFSG